jgi:hypothetical protein
VEMMLNFKIIKLIGVYQLSFLERCLICIQSLVMWLLLAYTACSVPVNQHSGSRGESQFQASLGYIVRSYLKKQPTNPSPKKPKQTKTWAFATYWDSAQLRPTTILSN